MSGACIVKQERPTDDISAEWTNYKLYCALHKPPCTAEKIKKFIKAGADVNCKDHEGRTLLHHIATIPNCEWEAIKTILKSGAKVNAKDLANSTPLHIAAMHADKNFSFIHELLQYGSEVNSRNNEGNTPLHLAAASFCRWNVVKKLVDAGAKVNARNYNGNTPLHFAIEYLRSNTASELLISGADVNIRNGAGSMPLHLALKLLPQGYIVGDILNAGASVNDRNGDGYSPLHLAVANGSSAASNLLKLGSLVGALDCSGVTAQRYIGHSVGHIGPILYSEEYDFARRVRSSYLPLHLAMKSADWDIRVQEILSSGIEINTQDINGMTPLHHATKNPRCNAEIIEMLIIRGGCVNAVDLEGNCPLHYALQRTTVNLSIVHTLLIYGTKVGIRNRFGDNVLHCALKNRSIARDDLLTCFKMLVKLAIIQNEFLSIKFCFELISKLPELFSYKSECLEESKRMKNIVAHNSMSIFDFVVGKGDDLQNQVEQVFQVLLTNSFPIYVDIILNSVKKKYLQEKVLTQKIYATYKLPFKTNRVVLKSDCVRHLVDFLSKVDLLNLFIAFGI